MELREVLAGLDNLKAKGNLELEINKIEKDSRKVKTGDIFVAIKGFEVDGHEYISDAVKNGAIAVVVDSTASIKKISVPENVTLIVAEDTRKALSIMAGNFYKHPSKRFKLIGITGTKGKTTTTFMIKQILEKAGNKVGLIGSVAVYIGDKKLHDSERTTPESLELQELFVKMVKEKVDYVVMEVSSQSLKLGRVEGLEFDVAVFTNFSKDHISVKEHEDMDDYFNSKLKIFNMSKTFFVNADDYHVIKVKKMFPELNIRTYGIDNPADFLAKDDTVQNSGADYKIKIGQRNERIKVSIPGRFSIYNSLAAICVALKYDVDVEKIKEALLEIKVPGRSELIANDKGLSIMIDYAHSPESLENILSALKSYCRGSVISVFGCGGNRDSSKRPIMGEISGKIADYTIITTDNPRDEEPQSIINQIEEGIKRTNGKYECIADRIQAIKKAIKIATKNDIIVLAGKGHEPYQEIKGEKLSFDEREIVTKILKEV